MNTKQLRQKILDLAIRGKLVPQDTNDEPASALLQRIREERRVSKTKPDKQDASSDKSPYRDLKEGWKVVKLGDIGHWQAGTTPSRTNKAYYENGTIPWLKTGDLNDGFVSEVPEKITELAKQELKQLNLHPKGSVAIALYGATIGKCGIFNIETTTNQACLVCQPNELIYNKFLFYFLISQNDYFKENAGGSAQPNISKEIVVKTEIPLPPLPEQQLIVAQIETIFAQLDDIEKEVK